MAGPLCRRLAERYLLLQSPAQTLNDPIFRLADDAVGTDVLINRKEFFGYREGKWPI
jgi:hypothetical protein